MPPTDTDRLDFLECYVRNKLDLHAVCAEYGLKYNTAAARLKAIEDSCAKRRAEAGNEGTGAGAGTGKAKAAGGKKKVAAAAAGKRKTPTKSSKKRKVEVFEEGNEEEDGEAQDVKQVKEEKKNGVKGEEVEDDDYDFVKV